MAIGDTKRKDPASIVDRYWTPPGNPVQAKRILTGLLSVSSRVLPASFFAIA